MMLLYCDDSFFLDTDYSKKMKHKLEVIIKEEAIQCVCISVGKDVHDCIDDFASKHSYTTFVKSKNRIKFEEQEIVLNHTSLRIQDEIIQPFSGTICFVDTKTSKWNRIYLDLFPDQETDIMAIMNDAFEDFIHDLFKTCDKEN